MDEQLIKDMGKIEFIPGTIQKGYKYKALIPKAVWNRHREDTAKNDKKVRFGDPKHEHFYDTIGSWGHLNHGDVYRREKYLARAGKIRNKKGELTSEIPFTPNFFSTRLLW